MEWRLKVRLLGWRQVSEDLLRRLEGVYMDSPYLNELTCQFRRQMRQVGWRLAIICNPHQVTVDEDGKVVPSFMTGALVTNEHR